MTLPYPTLVASIEIKKSDSINQASLFRLRYDLLTLPCLTLPWLRATKALLPFAL